MCSRWADWSRGNPCEESMMQLSQVAPDDGWSHLSGDVFGSVVEGAAQTLAPQLRLVCKEWKQLADDSVVALQPGDMRCCTMFPRLASLDLRRCPASVGSRAMQALQSLVQLQDVNLQGCEQLTDEGMQSLSGLWHLQTLSLSGCWQLTDMALQHLLSSRQGTPQRTASLTALDLSSCLNLTGSGVASFLSAAGGNLRSLCLEDMYPVHADPVSDHTLEAISALRHLRSLSLDGITSFSEGGMKHLAGLTNLTALNLGGCSQLSDGHLGHLYSLTNLEQLDLSVTGVSDGLVFGLAQRMPHLKALALASCEMLVGSILFALSVVAPQLEELNMHSNMWVTDLSIQGLSGLKGLRKLNVGYCVALTDQGLSAFSLMTNLRGLSLSGCLWVTCSPLMAQLSPAQDTAAASSPGPQRCPEGAEVQATSPASGPFANLQALTDLDLSGSGLSDAGLCQLSMVRRLEKLDVSACSNITSCGVATAILALKGLQTINVEHCPRVCMSTAEMIMSAAGKLLPAVANLPALEMVAAC